MIQWLDEVSSDAEAIFIVGDLFDFWFEYRHAVPRGYVRLLGKLATLVDRGVRIEAFTGNHDMWLFDYFPTELGIPVHHDCIQVSFGGKRFFIGHGDGKGPGDYGYKFIKRVFANRFCQWLFARLHPNLGIGLANFFSRRSRAVNGDEAFHSIDQEWLVQYSERKSAALPEVDYFIFGHRHVPLDVCLSNAKSRYVNLGDWMYHFTFAVFDGEELSLRGYLTGEVHAMRTYASATAEVSTSET